MSDNVILDALFLGALQLADSYCTFHMPFMGSNSKKNDYNQIHMHGSQHSAVARLAAANNHLVQPHGREIAFDQEGVVAKTGGMRTNSEVEQEGVVKEISPSCPQARPKWTSEGQEGKVDMYQTDRFAGETEGVNPNPEGMPPSIRV